MRLKPSDFERGVSRTTTIVVSAIVIIIIAAAAAGVYLSQHPSTSSSTTTPTGTTTTPTSSSTGATSSAPQTLTLEDYSWATGDLNQLTSTGAIPYSNWLDYTVYQSLVTLNGSLLYSTGQIQILPMLSDRWTSTNNQTWDFHIRQGVSFSNGDPLNSYQIWGEDYGLYYLSGNTSGWAVGYNVFNMGKANFGPSTLSLMNQSGLINPSPQLLSIMSNSSWPIYVNGSQDIAFNLKAPFQWFPNMWVQFTALIFDTNYVLRNGGFGTPTAINTLFNQHPIPGTGPYEVTNVVEDSYVQFVQNPSYWGDGLTSSQIHANPYLDPGHVKNVIIYAKTDDVSRYVDLSSGFAQIVPIQTQDWPLVTSNPTKYGTLVLPPNADNIVGLALNTLRYPTNITAVREAIAYAINYTAVGDSAFLGTQGGGLSPMMGPTYPGQAQYYDLGNVPPYNYNVSKAQQILSTAGINTAKLPTLEFRVIAGCNICINAAQVVQADLSAIGISVNVEVTAPNEYAPPLVAGSGTYSQEAKTNGTVAQITWFGTGTFAPDEPTPADSWLTWVSNETSANNWAIYSNPTVQACVNGFTNGTPQSTLLSLCTAAQAQVAHDAPYIWLGSVRLWLGGGSLVYNKQVISGFICDPVFSGSSEEPIFNTVTFVGQ